MLEPVNVHTYKNNLKVEMIMNKYKSLVSAPKFKHPTP